MPLTAVHLLTAVSFQKLLTRGDRGLQIVTNPSIFTTVAHLTGETVAVEGQPLTAWSLQAESRCLKSLTL